MPSSFTGDFERFSPTLSKTLGAYCSTKSPTSASNPPSLNSRASSPSVPKISGKVPDAASVLFFVLRSDPGTYVISMIVLVRLPSSFKTRLSAEGVLSPLRRILIFAGASSLSFLPEPSPDLSDFGTVVLRTLSATSASFFSLSPPDFAQATKETAKSRDNMQHTALFPFFT